MPNTRPAPQWTDEKALKAQLQRSWDRGVLLLESLETPAPYPKRLVFKKPTSQALSNQFEAVRQWIQNLQSIKGFRIESKRIRHRILGENDLPHEAWIDTIDNAVQVLGKRQAMDKFSALVAQTQAQLPSLMDWVKRYPIKALALANDWPSLLTFICWRQQHPKPAIYLRQVSLKGIDTKFIERHRGTLTALLDMALPADQIDGTATGISQFEQRYGFRSKPLRIRFRLLDKGLPLFGGDHFSDSDDDISLTAHDLNQLDQLSGFNDAIQNVFITENEINFLTFPKMRNALVIFGSGYGFDALSDIQWLQAMQVVYWGDLDTHGFAILDQLRAKLPHVQSVLMDESTLLAHHEFWGEEGKPTRRDLPRLTEDEFNVYQGLRQHTYGHNLRLEQEQIRYDWVLKNLIKPIQIDP